MDRRTFLLTATAVGTVPAFAFGQERFEVTRSEAEWRELLGDLEYRVMREMGTERPFTSPLNSVKEEGLFHCKGCDQALYSSETKFDSGTGWPSFTTAIEGTTETKPDRSLWMVRTEEHCARCGSHMGHIFEDGPPPTNIRHCINGICLVFRPSGSGEVVVG